jgi:hypothetical protein
VRRHHRYPAEEGNLLPGGVTRRASTGKTLRWTGAPVTARAVQLPRRERLGLLTAPGLRSPTRLGQLRPSPETEAALPAPSSVAKRAQKGTQGVRSADELPDERLTTSCPCEPRT